jgi:ABC-2 type transport system ATP-binding protein
MGETLIQVEGLRKNYDSRQVVNDISFSIKEGEILAIIGPNGAGKSTTLEMILGLRRQDEGSIDYWTENYKQEIGVQLQQTPFFPGLTAIENLGLFAAFYHKKLSSENGNKILQLCNLEGAAKKEASKLSGGQQKRLSIAAALVHEPKLVFLDEPTAALDPRSRQEIHQVLRTLRKTGTTIVFTSHDMDEVGKLADRVLMFNSGAIIASGNPKTLCEECQVKNLEDLYLKLTEGVN